MSVASSHVGSFATFQPASLCVSGSPKTLWRSSCSFRFFWKLRLVTRQQYSTFSRVFVTPPPVGMAEYCDERVCLFVCPREHISGTASDLHQIFVHAICVPMVWLGSLLVALRYVMYFRFIRDVISAHNGPYEGMSVSLQPVMLLRRRTQANAPACSIGCVVS